MFCKGHSVSEIPRYFRLCSSSVGAALLSKFSPTGSSYISRGKGDVADTTVAAGKGADLHRRNCNCR
jgi:hypothetical protein